MKFLFCIFIGLFISSFLIGLFYLTIKIIDYAEKYIPIEVIYIFFLGILIGLLLYLISIAG